MKASTSERLLARSVKDGDCLRWTGAHISVGYGHIRYRGKSTRVHRVAYMEWVGPIPEGAVIDHLCRVRDCINPTHLEAVTQAENLRRGIVAGTIKIGQVRRVCKRGHDRTAPGSLAGSSSCRQCKQRHAECPTCGAVITAYNLPRHARRHAGVSS